MHFGASAIAMLLFLGGLFFWFKGKPEPVATHLDEIEPEDKPVAAKPSSSNKPKKRK
ncbi:MAG: hypothetical protein IPL65_02880 [Lewinellaceae bacterium]|nr:hypothetical protein [Lewinellaceae bacterium]